MEIELLEIRDFLAVHHPFDQLSDPFLTMLPEKLEIRYFRRNTSIPDSGSVNNYLYIVRSGAVELLGKENELLARLSEGDVFGYRASHRETQEKQRRGTAIEDTLVYQLSASDVDHLCDKNPQFAYFFGPAGSDLLKDVMTSSGQDPKTQVSLMTTPIKDLINRQPITISPSSTIRETALKMSEERVSSILVCAEGQLAGIVTDRDLRNRVVAEGLDYDIPITEIMTFNPTTVDESDFAFEAQLKMARKNVHHLPVVRGDKIMGMLTVTDITKHDTTSAVYLVNDIYKMDTVEQMQRISAKVPQLLQSLASADATANSAGHVITAITDAITNRLLQLAEEKLGPPPVAYAWLAAGSQARNEQTAKSDQDNCLLIDDSYDPSTHGQYFQDMSRLVCDGLDACGYIYCPGEMMATTDKWRQPLQTWKHYFNRWIDQPEPMALMLTCVFFDLRCVHGNINLFRELREYVLRKTRGNRIFLAHMVGNALTHQPPLGFFRNFVLIKGGEHDQTFDLKHTGIIPIVDLARVYALAAGSEAVNTQDRLAEVAEGGEVTADSARDLSDALEFICFLRIEHQARQIRNDQQPDNFMSPDDLSHFERNHLKDAFSVVRTMQNVLSQRYTR
ncbi:MAG: cyclic nucleotide-binding/CBS domain-containing protein [Gammaproteobacteria bacterium]|nr:cyclic nucleotide-binding/CBS domain-containing protein [Gammaproteobacteria bacterium]